MRPARTLVPLALVCLIAGCASTGGANLQSKSSYYDDVDWERMTQITREAERRGHKVWWVNPPQKSHAARQRDEADRG
jgi:hypothetical protein